MGMHTKAGVGDKVSFQIKRAPIPPKKPNLIKKLKEKISKVMGSFSGNEDTSDDDDDDDDDLEPNSIKRDPFVGLFFMARK